VTARGGRQLVGELDRDDLAMAESFETKVRWRFASTMPDWPHEYTMRSWRPDLAGGLCHPHPEVARIRCVDLQVGLQPLVAVLAAVRLLELADDGIPVAVTCRLGFSKQAFYQGAPFRSAAESG
jgi:hypothetical protein